MIKRFGLYLKVSLKLLEYNPKIKSVKIRLGLYLKV